jgi:hypothetical protein
MSSRKPNPARQLLLLRNLLKHMSPKFFMKSLVFFGLLFAIISAHAQRGIRLTNRHSKREKFIEEGSRVYYEYANPNHPMNVSYHKYGPRFYGVRGIGIMRIINDSLISVDQEQIKLKEIMRIGARKKGAGIGSGILCVGGFVLTLASASRDSGPQELVDPFLLSLGLVCEIAGIADIANRSPKSSSTWKIEVANAPQSSVH